VSLTRTQTHLQQMQKEKARRQNLQQVLERRVAEIRRLRERLDAYESDFQEMERRTSDLNMSLFRESGLRILAEKEEGANRLKLEQLEKQVSDGRKKLRQQQDESAETIRRMQDLINSQEKEIARLRQANARRIKKPAVDTGLENQITLDDVLGQ
jgi:chromosome segregation ATPase